MNYRGSTGFGKSFVAASEKQHAAKMHDDLIDMVNWAIGEGIADPAKIAIYGGSYGGYASFVGATFTPEVFCCSVPVVGITNLQTLLESMPPYWAGFAEFMYRSYGDPRTEEGRALLAERSPIHKVDRITKPMLIFHGANDVRCKVEESDTIVAAMQAKGIPVTYVVYPDEGTASTNRAIASPTSPWQRRSLRSISAALSSPSARTSGIPATRSAPVRRFSILPSRLMRDSCKRVSV